MQTNFRPVQTFCTQEVGIHIWKNLANSCSSIYLQTVFFMPIEFPERVSKVSLDFGPILICVVCTVWLRLGQSCPLIGGHGGRRAILRFPRAWRRASANVARRWSGPQARELESWAATTGTVLRPRHRGTQTQAGSQNPAVEPPQLPQRLLGAPNQTCRWLLAVTVRVTATVCEIQFENSPGDSMSIGPRVRLAPPAARQNSIHCC